MSAGDPIPTAEAVDRHIVLALHIAESMGMSRDDAEYYVRNRLVAISDAFPSPEELSSEKSRRVLALLQKTVLESEK